MTDGAVGFGGTTPDPVNTGDDLTVKFKNPALANQTITVTARNGSQASETFEIELDANGEGQATFTVPAGWIVVMLQHSSVPDYAVQVNP